MPLGVGEVKTELFKPVKVKKGTKEIAKSNTRKSCRSLQPLAGHHAVCWKVGNKMHFPDALAAQFCP